MGLAQRLSSAARIHFEARIPQSDVLERAREADCLVINVLDQPVYRFGLGLNKFYAYMSAFRPVLVATSYSSPISESGGGITVPSDDVGALADSMVKVALLSVGERREMAARGYRLVRSAYGYETLTARFARVLDLVADRRDSPESGRP
jgi:glycosyltransferase involved in cell wall biosynthesis